MAMLELECPSCRQLLELDAGFAGGVCRCSSCGTLMTVPADPAHDHAQRLTRPERPDSPGAPAGSRPESPTEAPAPSESDAAGDVEHTETYITETGQSVELRDDTRIPTAARKNRPMVRALTAALFIGFLLVVVAMVIFALSIILTDPPAAAPQQLDQIAIEQFGYDPDVNPFTLDNTNVLGLPLQQRTAVVVDASATSSAWLSLVKDALVAGLADQDDEQRVGLIYAAEASPLVLADQLEPIAELDAERLIAFQEPIPAAGVAPLHVALGRALSWEPGQVILITAQRLRPDQVAALTSAMEGHSAVVLDIIMLGEASPELEALVQQRSGRLVRLSPNQLTRWYQAR